jgi:hypothetical protein
MYIFDKWIMEDSSDMKDAYVFKIVTLWTNRVGFYALIAPF